MKIAQFKTGDTVRYLGTRQSESGIGIDPIMKPLIYPNMIAEIIKTLPSQKGLGRIMVDGEMIIDYDADGYNVYRNQHGIGQIIWPRDGADWEVIKSTE